MSAWEEIFSAWMPDPGGDPAYRAAMESVVREEADLLCRGGPTLALDELSDAYPRREAAALRVAFRSGFLLGVRLMAQDGP